MCVSMNQYAWSMENAYLETADVFWSKSLNHLLNWFVKKCYFIPELNKLMATFEIAYPLSRYFFWISMYFMTIKKSVMNLCSVT